MSTKFDFWVRELYRTDLPAPAQQELLQRLAWTFETRTKYFAASLLVYVESMKELLLLTFLLQKGPVVFARDPGIASDVFPRS